MEDREFDRIIKEKLKEADTPAYEEQKWKFFQAMPGRRSNGKMKNIVYYIALASILLNIYQALRTVGTEPATNVLAFVDNKQPSGTAPQKNDAITRSIVLYDTIYKTIVVERKRRIAESEWDNIAVSEYFTGQTIHLRPSSDANSLGLITPSTPGDNFSAPVQPHILIPDRMASGKAVASVAGTDTLSEKIRENDEIIPSRRGKNFFRPEIWLGLTASKPFLTSSKDVEKFHLSEYGIRFSYHPVPWAGLTGGVYYQESGYDIANRAFYLETVPNEENNADDPNDPEGNPYGGGDNPYGTDYVYVRSELEETGWGFDAGVSITPLYQSAWRPYLDLSYVHRMNANVNIKNQLMEQPSGKFVFAEGYYSPTSVHLIRTGAGLETPLGYSFRLRLGVDYAFRLNQRQYLKNLFGVQAGLSYQLR